MTREIDRAVKLLKPLLAGLAEDRDKTIDVYADVYKWKIIERLRSKCVFPSD